MCVDFNLDRQCVCSCEVHVAESYAMQSAYVDSNLRLPAEYHQVHNEPYADIILVEVQ